MGNLTVILPVLYFQAVLRVFMASTAIRSVTAPTMDAAIAHTEPVCVIPASMGDFAISVSPNTQKLSAQLLKCICFSSCIFFLVSQCSACPRWSFGPGCSSECQCVQRNTLECDRRYGACICKPGYQGRTCSEGQ